MGLNDYLSIARKYLAGGIDESLLEAYELGQMMGREHAYVDELIALHHDALPILVTERPCDAVRIMEAMKRILLEALAPFEQRSAELRSHQLDQRALNDKLRQQTIVLDQINAALRTA